MTKKDFIAMADMIRKNRMDFSDAAINQLADFCNRQNCAFKRDRWIDYINGECGPNGGVVAK